MVLTFYNHHTSAAIVTCPNHKLIVSLISNCMVSAITTIAKVPPLVLAICNQLEH